MFPGSSWFCWEVYSPVEPAGFPGFCMISPCPHGRTLQSFFLCVCKCQPQIPADSLKCPCAQGTLLGRCIGCQLHWELHLERWVTPQRSLGQCGLSLHHPVLWKKNAKRWLGQARFESRKRQVWEKNVSAQPESWSQLLFLLSSL